VQGVSSVSKSDFTAWIGAQAGSDEVLLVSILSSMVKFTSQQFDQLEQKVLKFMQENREISNFSL
jgi:hypothetical protein